MLEEIAKVGDESIVSWQPHGKAFRVHFPEAFARTVMPRYFKKQTKYKSFLRQLHLYGFHRIREGIDEGAYCHSMFIRNKTSMSLQMTRQRIKRKKKSGSDAAVVHECAAGDPDFYLMGTNVDNNQYQDGRNVTNALHSDRPPSDEGFFAGKRFFMVGGNENVVDNIQDDCFSVVVNRRGRQVAK
jgi:hypothetical protein